MGVLGHVGRFTSDDAARYPRGQRVIVQTQRGLEIGEVLLPPNGPVAAGADGRILRPMTAEDELLETRLEKNRDEAFAACANRVAELNLPVTLIDVEHLFDGQGLYFYFLGEAPPELAELTEELAQRYEGEVQFRKFTETLEAGCGPDCGTGDAGGCGDCSSGCALAASCRK